MIKAAVSPSMMCAPLTGLEGTLRELENGKTEFLHIDIMDGHFVPNFTLGTDYCRMLKELTSIPLDIHLMVERPEEKLPWFSFGEGDMVSVHAESTPHLQKALAYIKSRGAAAFAALNPATPLCALDEITGEIDGVLIMCVNPGFAGQKAVPGCFEKIRRCRSLLDERGRQDARIEVDGNVSLENAVKMRAAGADIFVAGTSSIFSPGSTVAQGLEKLRECLKD